MNTFLMCRNTIHRSWQSGSRATPRQWDSHFMLMNIVEPRDFKVTHENISSDEGTDSIDDITNNTLFPPATMLGMAHVNVVVYQTYMVEPISSIAMLRSIASRNLLSGLVPFTPTCRQSHFCRANGVVLRDRSRHLRRSIRV